MGKKPTTTSLTLSEGISKTMKDSSDHLDKKYSLCCTNKYLLKRVSTAAPPSSFHTLMQLTERLLQYIFYSYLQSGV